jgi:hypothetical protein
MYVYVYVYIYLFCVCVCVCVTMLIHAMRTCMCDVEYVARVIHMDVCMFLYKMHKKTYRLVMAYICTHVNVNARVHKAPCISTNLTIEQNSSGN